MVLYYCCPPRVRAGEIVERGFPDGEVVPVTDHPPKADGRYLLEDMRAVVFLGVPFDFPFDSFPLEDAADGGAQRLIPWRVLNALPRALWE